MMPDDLQLRWIMGLLLVSGLFFWVSVVITSEKTHPLRSGWGWLQWRPFPHDLPYWMAAGFLLGFLLQIGLAVWVRGGALDPPVGMTVLLSIGSFHGLLALILFLRLRRAGLEPMDVLGMDPPLRLRDMVWGLAGYCMTLPLVALAGLLTQAVYSGLRLDLDLQPLLQEIQEVRGWMNWGTLFLTAGFIGPLLEEVIFRGFLLTWLRQRMGVQSALWLQALVFALIHQHAGSMLALFALSVMLGLAYVYTRRLMVCVWMHVIFNSFTLINAYWMTQGGGVG